MKMLDAAESQARAVLALAPGSAQAHGLLAYAEFERGHLVDAARHFKLALEREPNDPDVLLYYGLTYIYAGDFERAAQISARLTACDPLGMFSWVLAGVVKWFPGGFAAAVEPLRHSVELDPNSFMAHWTLGYVHAALGHVEHAADQVACLQQIAGHVPYTLQLKAIVDALSGQKARAAEWLAMVDPTPLDQHVKFHVAEAYAMAGIPDRALEMLQSAVEHGFYPYPYLAEHCPFLAPLRAMPRFDQILVDAKRRADAFSVLR